MLEPVSQESDRGKLSRHRSHLVLVDIIADLEKKNNTLADHLDQEKQHSDKLRSRLSEVETENGNLRYHKYYQTGYLEIFLTIIHL